MKLFKSLEEYYHKATSDSQTAIIFILLVITFLKGLVFALLMPLTTFTSSESSDINLSLTLRHTGLSLNLLYQLLANPATLYHKLVGMLLFNVNQSFHPVQLLLARLIGVGFTVIVVWLAFRISQMIVPENKLVQLLVPIFIALQPQFSFVSSSVEATNFYILGFSLLLYLSIKVLPAYMASHSFEGLRKLVLSVVLVAAIAFPLSSKLLIMIGIAIFIIHSQPNYLRRRFNSKKLASLKRALICLLISLIIWLPVLPDVFGRVFTSSALPPSLPTAQTLSSPPTVLWLLQNLTGLTDGDYGWRTVPFNIVFLLGFLLIGISSLTALCIPVLKQIYSKLKENDVYLLSKEQVTLFAIFLGALIMSYFFQDPLAKTISILLPFPSFIMNYFVQESSISNILTSNFPTLSEALSLLLPYIPMICFAGLLFITLMVLRDQEKLMILRKIFTISSKAENLGLILCGGLVFYAIAIRALDASTNENYPLIAIVPAALLLMIGLTRVLPKKWQTPNLISDFFFVLFLFLWLYIVKQIFSGTVLLQLPASAPLNIEPKLAIVPLIPLIWCYYWFSRRIKELHFLSEEK